MPESIEEIRARLGKQPQTRSFLITRDSVVDDEKRTVTLAFASDKPVSHWMGDVVLSMDQKNVRTERLKSGAPLLMDHNRQDQIGVVENFTFDKKEGVARATVRFSKSARGQEIFQDVIDGIRPGVSVGFMMYDIVLQEEKEGEPSVYRCNDWEPLEISIVSIPADISVGVGRALDEKPTEVLERSSADKRANETAAGENTMSQEDNAAAASANPTTRGTAAPAVVETRSASEMAAEEINRWGENLSCPELAKRYLSESFVREEDITVKGFKEFVKANQTPSTSVPAGDPAAEAARQGGYRPASVDPRLDVRSIGEAFIQNAIYRSTVGKSRQRGTQVGVDIPIMPNALKRATFDSGSTGLQGYINYAAGPIMVEQQRLTIRDLLSVGQTNLPSVPYIRETSYTNAAETVAEEGKKPEATFALQDEFARVQKIAVIGRVTDEMWNDFPTLRDYINGRLRFMVQEREEAQLLSGAGTGSEITGILTESIQSQALSSDTHADAVHKAITKIRAVGKFEPDGAVFHPDDWQQMRLAKDDNNQYYGGGPFSGPYGNGAYAAAERYWGLPVVVTTAIASGTGLVGAFKLGAQIWDREGITVDATNSDEDDFQYNRMAIRVEERLALAIYRPLAFCKVTGI